MKLLPHHSQTGSRSTALGRAVHIRVRLTTFTAAQTGLVLQKVRKHPEIPPDVLQINHMDIYKRYCLPTDMLKLSGTALSGLNDFSLDRKLSDSCVGMDRCSAISLSEWTLYTELSASPQWNSKRVKGDNV